MFRLVFLSRIVTALKSKFCSIKTVKGNKAAVKLHSKSNDFISHNKVLVSFFVVH